MGRGNDTSSLVERKRRLKARTFLVVMTISAAALLCLSSVIYHEARGETKQGQIAVAQVVMNRVKSKHFPDTVCGVVKQPNQFSWYNKKGMTNAKESLARRIISGHYNDSVDGALYFRSGGGLWKRLRFVMQIGRHRFFK
jgi:N-acetylmuramoyl-L-alanine amidase